jgi:hypothetical protein
MISGRTLKEGAAAVRVMLTAPKIQPQNSGHQTTVYYDNCGVLSS